MKRFILLSAAILIITKTKAQYDVCVYGGTSAGVIAAYTASKLGKKVILIEPGKHLGGLTSGGLGYTDIGNKYVGHWSCTRFLQAHGKTLRQV
jgi:NADPH-dependent 2,4-dienoyl-CoA reductase/sulfur reductase-like enzyme